MCAATTGLAVELRRDVEQVLDMANAAAVVFPTSKLGKHSRC